MNSRKLILERLRSMQSEQQQHYDLGIVDKNYFRYYEVNTHRLLNQFKNKLTTLHGNLIMVKDKKEASNQLIEIIKKNNLKKCLIHDDPLLKSIIQGDTLLSQYVSDNSDLNSKQFADFDSGITTAEYLIARTGSIIVNSKDNGGRRLSVLPPIHIVCAFQKQLVPSLDHAFKKMRQNGFDWSFATIISGPSRTSDIEKQLVLGAHGSKKLIVILIEN